MNKKIILIIGLPGSGKTSISNKINLPYLSHFSIGEMYRIISSENTPLGKTVKKNIESGKFVPIEIAHDVIKNFIEKGDKMIIIDGFPRSMAQVRMFDNLIQSITCNLSKIIEILVDYEIAFKRISNRQRGVDDRKELFATRIALYESDIKKIRTFYTEKQLYVTLDGNLPFQEVVNNLSSILHFL